MESEWSIVAFRSLASISREQINPADYPDEAFDLYSIPAFDNGGQPERVLGNDIQSNKFLVPGGSVLVSKLNPRIPRVWEPKIADGTRAVCSTEFLVLIPKLATDRRYLRYLCLSPQVADILISTATGTSGSHQRTSAEELLGITVQAPDSRTERARIASLLGALDDKIELNHRMNQTLEEMARALFKSWFVDFDPVKAKAAGKPTGLPKEIEDLFPSEFEESELGMVPKGWGVGSIGSIASRCAKRVGSRNAVVLSAVASGELIRSDSHFTKRVYSSEISRYLLVEQWDFAFNPSRINIGSIGMLEEDIDGAVSPVYIVARPHKDYRWYIWFALMSPLVISWINVLASGSVRQSLSYDGFSSIPLVIPPGALVQEFNAEWEKLHDSIRSHSDNAEVLCETRDVLLPKLISGELRIPTTDNG